MRCSPDFGRRASRQRHWGEKQHAGCLAKDKAPVFPRQQGDLGLSSQEARSEALLVYWAAYETPQTDKTGCLKQ